MKRIIILIIFVAITGSGCKKFLGTTPSDYVAPENFFENESQLNAAYLAVYDVLGQNGFYGRGYSERFVIGTDESYSTLYANAGPWNNNHAANDPQLTLNWNALYQGIERANIVLANIGKVQMDEARKSIIKGEVLFLRAYYYFMLGVAFGGVPLRLEPTAGPNDVIRARATIKEVYDQILKDMTEAEGLVLTATQIGFGGRVSKSAVQGSLARVCMTMAGEPLRDVAKWQDAKNWAQKIISSNEHRLNPDYTDIFIKIARDQYDIKEVIWEVEKWGTVGGVNNEFGTLGSLSGIPGLPTAVGHSFGQVQMTRKYFNLFPDPGLPVSRDMRREWNIAPYRYSATADGKPFLTWGATEIWPRHDGKYRRIYETTGPKNNDNTSLNFPILRYADVLLMWAEAENELNGPTPQAYSYINQVRARAWGKLLPGATNPTEADLTDLSKVEFRQAIQDERARELSSEGYLRRFDLLRWGIYLSAIKAVAADVRATVPAPPAAILTGVPIYGDNATQKHLLWPIPVAEFSYNTAIVQNPGW